MGDESYEDLLDALTARLETAGVPQALRAAELDRAISYLEASLDELRRLRLAMRRAAIDPRLGDPLS